MNKENTSLLIEKFPNLYESLHYFEVGNGWFQIIHELSEDLERLVLDYNKPENEEHENYGSKCCAVQVKEKYGTLRFYMSCETQSMSSLIHLAEKKSQTICEICGEKGVFRMGGWMSVRCDSHI